VASYERAGKIRTGSFALDPPPTPNLLAAKKPKQGHDEEKTGKPRYAGSGIIIPGGRCHAGSFISDASSLSIRSIVFVKPVADEYMGKAAQPQ